MATASAAWADGPVEGNPALALARSDPRLVVMGEGEGGLVRVTTPGGAPICGEESAYAHVIVGHWTGDGAWAPEGFTVACEGGAPFKCVERGFAPWDGTAQALDRHLACVRLVRADYCGDGVATTDPGLRIRISEGTQPPDRAEAGWNRDGAVVINRTRTEAGLAHVLSACPERLSPGDGRADVILWNE
ncbi:MAG: ADYC domain-containing protein [Rubricella sp.]